MSTTRFSGYTSTFVHAGGTLTLNQLQGATISPGQRFDEIMASGAVDRLASIMGSATPVATIPTADLTTVFGTVSAVSGLACTGNCTFQYQKRTDSGIFTSGSAHTKILATNGFLCPQSVSASGDSPAACNLQFWPLWDGTNIPLVASNSVALAGTAPAFNSQFYLGPCFIGDLTTPLEGLVSASVDFGIGFRPIMTDGDPYPRIGSIYSRAPRFRLEFLKLDMVAATIASLFHANVGDNLLVSFRKGSAGGVRVADTSAAHLLITTTDATWNPDQVSFAGETDTTVSIEVRPNAALSFALTELEGA